MNFGQVFEALRAGVRVRRAHDAWIEIRALRGFSETLPPGDSDDPAGLMDFIVSSETGCRWCPSDQDILAVDWEIEGLTTVERSRNILEHDR